MTKTQLTCPDCEGSKVTTAHIQTFMVNTGDHYCHSVKTQDSDSPARCTECGWTGERQQLIEAPEAHKKGNQ